MGSINQIAFGNGLAVVKVPMAKPLWAIVRAELPKAPDLFAERSIPRGGSSSSRRRDLVFIVNPKDGRYDSNDMQAIRDGADAVIVMGGDGTLHEVVNGFFWAGKSVTNYDKEATHSTALGLIPLGTVRFWLIIDRCLKFIEVHLSRNSHQIYAGL